MAVLTPGQFISRVVHIQGSPYPGQLHVHVGYYIVYLIAIAHSTEKEQEADANRDTTVFHTQTSGGGPPNGRPSSPVKPTIKGIDNPAMDVDNLTLQEQYAIEGATTNQTDTSDYIRHDSLNPPQLTHYGRS